MLLKIRTSLKCFVYESSFRVFPKETIKLYIVLISLKLDFTKSILKFYKIKYQKPYLINNVFISLNLVDYFELF